MTRRYSIAWPPLLVPAVVCACLVSAAVDAQQITVSAKSSLEQQQESIQKQRESIERQLSTIRTRTGGETKPKLRSSPASFTESVLPAFEPVEMPEFPLAVAPAPFDCPALPGQTIDRLVNSAAKREDLSVDLLRAVIKRESAFHPCAVSDKGALGLMQLMPGTAEQFGVDDPFNPVQNVRGGAAFLKQLLNRFGGDTRLALGAYNAGPERVAAANGIPDLQETQDYVAAISADAHLALPEPAEQPTTNAMTKPDLRHLSLIPGLLPEKRNYFRETTPVHLTSEPQDH